MFTHVRTRAVAAITGLLIIAGCAGSGSIAPQIQQHAIASSAKFRQATATDKAQQRPSLADPSLKTGGRIAQNSGRGSKGSFTIVTSLTVDDSGAFAEWSTTCKPSIFEAPWYWAEGDFSLPVADSTTLAVCTASSRSGWGDDAVTRMNSPQITPTPPATPSPTPSPTPAGTPTNLDIVKVDIGWWSLSVKPVSGAATLSADKSTWSFPSMTTSDSFQDDHLYAFFVASWNGSTPPSP